MITKTEPLVIYADATMVKLFVGHIVNNEKSEFINPKGHLMTSSERSQFESFINRTIVVHRPETDEDATGTACFDPHHFFRYYDAGGQQVGENIHLFLL